MDFGGTVVITGLPPFDRGTVLPSFDTGTGLGT